VGCPAPADAAPRLLALYRFLQQEDLSAFRAELVEGQDFEGGLAARAEKACADALAAPTEASLQEAAQAHAALRTALKDHLDRLTAKRPAGGWQQLADARRELDGNLPLRATAVSLAVLRRGRRYDGPPPKADPPCLLHVDAL